MLEMYTGESDTEIESASRERTSWNCAFASVFPGATPIKYLLNGLAKLATEEELEWKVT